MVLFELAEARLRNAATAASSALSPVMFSARYLRLCCCSGQQGAVKIPVENRRVGYSSGGRSPGCCPDALPPWRRRRPPPASFSPRCRTARIPTTPQPQDWSPPRSGNPVARQISEGGQHSSCSPWRIRCCQCGRGSLPLAGPFSVPLLAPKAACGSATGIGRRYRTGRIGAGTHGCEIGRDADATERIVDGADLTQHRRPVGTRTVEDRTVDAR